MAEPEGNRRGVKTVNVLIDTCTVNRLLDIDERTDGDRNYEEDRSYLSRITKEYVESGAVQLLVNPTVKAEIDKTRDAVRKRELLVQFAQHHSTPFSAALFPITFPVNLLTDEENKALVDLSADLRREYQKDRKIFADAMCSRAIVVLLTTDLAKSRPVHSVWRGQRTQSRANRLRYMVSHGV